MSTPEPTTSAVILAQAYHRTLDRAVKIVADLTDEQLTWRPNATTNSLAWNLWRFARCIA